MLGATSMPIHQALRLGRGAIIELDASEEDEVQILANNFPVAKGMVVVSGNRIADEERPLGKAFRVLWNLSGSFLQARRGAPQAKETGTRGWTSWRERGCQGTLVACIGT